MPWDEYLEDRIHNILKAKGANYFAKKMMGGLVFMVNEKMACGIHFDKKQQVDLLMARIGPEATAANLERPGCQPMSFTGRVMKGYVFVAPEGFDMDEDLEHWIELCLVFNPLAKKSKKKKPKRKL